MELTTECVLFWYRWRPDYRIFVSSDSTFSSAIKMNPKPILLDSSQWFFGFEKKKKTMAIYLLASCNVEGGVTSVLEVGMK